MTYETYTDGDTTFVELPTVDDTTVDVPFSILERLVENYDGEAFIDAEGPYSTHIVDDGHSDNDVIVSYQRDTTRSLWLHKLEETVKMLNRTCGTYFRFLDTTGNEENPSCGAELPADGDWELRELDSDSYTSTHYLYFKGDENISDLRTVTASKNGYDSYVCIDLDDPEAVEVVHYD